MNLFRFLLATLFITCLSYTSIVGLRHGFSFMPIFFGDITQINWRGQFNLDFSFHLILSALWMAWRNNFNAIGFCLALLAFAGGIHTLTAYLFWLSFKVDSVEELVSRKRN